MIVDFDFTIVDTVHEVYLMYTTFWEFAVLLSSLNGLSLYRQPFLFMLYLRLVAILTLRSGTLWILNLYANHKTQIKCQYDDTNHLKTRVEPSPGVTMSVFWIVAPCSLVEVYWRFRCACCLHHQGNELRQQAPLKRW
jgi:hypothetical protein